MIYVVKTWDLIDSKDGKNYTKELVRECSFDDAERAFDYMKACQVKDLEVFPDNRRFYEVLGAGEIPVWELSKYKEMIDE